MRDRYGCRDTRPAEAQAGSEARQARLDTPMMTAFYRAENYHQRYLEQIGTACF
ncbi:hypothetical protein [Salinisphaera sp.]|uniref:hypothetical protein n=1 Tax=Salinisphaera sp. TaxID=1914330 RepID=UPI002D79BCCB|nr:hypothetical protein [Salinisphaera sp.]HET7313888.1 hypothetical protein [Salinisphaera sp.]